MRKSFPAVSIITVGVFVLSLFAAMDADAREGRKDRSGGGTITTDKGKTYRYDRSATGEAGNRTRTQTLTGENGKTRSRQAVNNFDREAGTGTRSVTKTGPNGGTVSRNTDWTRNEDGSWSYSGTRTGKDGNTSSYSGSHTRDR